MLYPSFRNPPPRPSHLTEAYPAILKSKYGLNHVSGTQIISGLLDKSSTYFLNCPLANKFLAFHCCRRVIRTIQPMSALGSPEHPGHSAPFPKSTQWHLDDGLRPLLLFVFSLFYYLCHEVTSLFRSIISSPSFSCSDSTASRLPALLLLPCSFPLAHHLHSFLRRP